MFIVTAKVPKRRTLLVCSLAALVLVLALTLVCCGAKPESGAGASFDTSINEGRVAYLESLGWEVTPEPVETLTLTLPDELVEPYLSYNAIQLEQGFDLAPYCGETLTRCTYAITNYPGRERGCQADLYLHEGAVVAGDVVCTGENGFIAPLVFPESAAGESR